MHANMKIHDISLDEIFIVSSIIDKLPPSWRVVRHAIKYKKEDISLFDVEQHIVIEFSITVHKGQKKYIKPIENGCQECRMLGNLKKNLCLRTCKRRQRVKLL